MNSRSTCNHRFRFYTMIGLAVPGHVVGTVDLWKCTNCGAVDANPRRIGDLRPPATVGFNVLDDNEKWAILSCFDNDAPGNWELIRVKPRLGFTHDCKGTEKSFLISEDLGLLLSDGTVPTRHELRLAEDYGEKTILILKQ